MNKNLLALLACALLASPMLASAIPIQYNLNYEASTGPNGVGSFLFDQDNGAMSAFNWDFEGTVGGIPDFNFNTPRPPGFDTLGRLLFEILTRTDVHANANCLQSGCVFTSSFGGPNPRKFMLKNTPHETFYEVEQGDVFSAGLVTFAPTAVPEPATFALFGLSLMIVGVARRRGVAGHRN